MTKNLQYNIKLDRPNKKAIEKTFISEKRAKQFCIDAHNKYNREPFIFVLDNGKEIDKGEASVFFNLD